MIGKEGIKSVLKLVPERAGKIYNSAKKLARIGDEILSIRSRLDAAEERSALVSNQLDRLEHSVSRLSEPEMMIANIETALISAGMTARALRLNSPLVKLQSSYRSAHPQEFDIYLSRLNALDPHLFPVWMELFENGKRSYYEQKEASCSHRTHRYAKLFGAYLEVYARGRILDIGCGPHGIPSYLASHDKSMISGVEPLPCSVEPNFECVRGFNEFLPWPDRSFHTVISGTSLDHVLSLDVSLAEVRRVLTPDGRYLVWLASIPGSATFNPKSTEFKPIDEFHLFHFDRAWVEPQFDRFFDIEDVTIIPQPGFDHVFYSMRQK